MIVRRTYLALVLSTLAGSFAWGAKADFGFEFDHAPAVDGAGYMLQPLNNVRAAGSMAIEVGQTLTLPSSVGGIVVDGQGFNNGDGTFSYDAADDGIATASMGFVQNASAGNATTDKTESPLIGQLNYTLEARFKVENVEIDPGQSRYRFLDLENNALGSLHFTASYGLLGGGHLALSTPTSVPFQASTGIDLVQGEWLTLRVVTTSLSGPANTGRVDTFIKLSDAGDWLVGPTITSTFSTTRDRGTLSNVCAENCGEFGKVTVDYIRGVGKSLALTESLDAAGGEPIPGDFNGDGSVNAADYAVWQSGFGGTLKGSDLLAWQRNFGATSAAVSAAAVPEASACGLALCGLAALAARRRTA